MAGKTSFCGLGLFGNNYFRRESSGRNWPWHCLFFHYVPPLFHLQIFRSTLIEQIPTSDRRQLQLHMYTIGRRVYSEVQNIFATMLGKNMRTEANESTIGEFTRRKHDSEGEGLEGLDELIARTLPELAVRQQFRQAVSSEFGTDIFLGKRTLFGAVKRREYKVPSRPPFKLFSSFNSGKTRNSVV